MKNRNQKKPKQPRHTGQSSYQQEKTGSGQSEQGGFSTQREQQEANKEQQQLHSDRGGLNPNIDRPNQVPGKGNQGGRH